MSLTTPHHLKLGRTVAIPTEYSADLLDALPRAYYRATLPSTAQQLFGEDRWRLYELSWLDSTKKPVNAIGTLSIPANSPHFLESKSLKLYLMGFHHSIFQNVAEVQCCIQEDLQAATQSEVQVSISTLSEHTPLHYAINQPNGICLDHLQTEQLDSPTCKETLQQACSHPVQECLYTNLFRSECPITQQPDWATVMIRYQGRPFQRTGLLNYLLSFRRHAAFHEYCVETMMTDILQACECQTLSISAHYTRRGGLEITPYRCSTTQNDPDTRLRTVRQ